MFIAGECASILLHRDLERPESGEESRSFSRGKIEGRFAGWHVLEDVEGIQGDEAASARIATRFLVARVIRALVDEDLVVDSASLTHQLKGVRREVEAQDPAEPERRVWERVLASIEILDLDGLLPVLLEWGGVVEAMGHLGGAREIHSMAYELAVALGSSGPAVDAARFLGRVSRKLTRWDDAIRWYDVARVVAEEGEDKAKLALVLDGMANTFRDRGNLPRARELLGRVMALGVEEGDRHTRAIAHHDLMTVEKLAGNLKEAVVHGWQAAQHYDSREGSLKAFFDLAGVLKESGELSASWDAYSVVAAQVKSRDYRLLSLDGMAHIAALRGQEGRYEALSARVEALNWREASPLPKAQVLLYRGLSCQALGRREEARKWLGEALAFAEKHRLSQLVFSAEGALGEIFSSAVTLQTGDLLPGLDSETEVLEVRQGLRRMREAAVGAGGPL
jgi:tetratricopeptide (TPR) repeat protein